MFFWFRSWWTLCVHLKFFVSFCWLRLPSKTTLRGGQAELHYVLQGNVMFSCIYKVLNVTTMRNPWEWEMPVEVFGHGECISNTEALKQRGHAEFLIGLDEWQSYFSPSFAALVQQPEAQMMMCLLHKWHMDPVVIGRTSLVTSLHRVKAPHVSGAKRGRDVHLKKIIWSDLLNGWSIYWKFGWFLCGSEMSWWLVLGVFAQWLLR